MPTYKLYYFNLRGRAQAARMLFKLAGQDFEDVRLTREEWATFKDKTPMGLLPVLEVDGTMICETHAIGRYLAREFGYAGKDSLSIARADMIIDSLYEIASKCKPVFDAETEEKKAAESKKYLEEAIEPGFEKIQKLLEQNGGGDGYFVGDEVTIADVTFVMYADFAMIVARSDLGKFPKLQALVARVEALPPIAAWIKERPDTPM